LTDGSQANPLQTGRGNGRDAASVSRDLEPAVRYDVATGLFALPGASWRVYGWLRGEPFYDGRPASYYASCIRRDAEQNRGGTGAWVRNRILQWAVDLFGLPGRPAMRGDAVPVLTVLLDDPDPRVRSFAAAELGAIGLPAAGPAVPALRRLKGDKDVTVAYAVDATLSALDIHTAGP
jgi:hypothetical protein